MPLSRVDENDLLLPLHDGMHETPLWGTFLGRLRRRARADGAALLIRRIGVGSSQDTQIYTFISGMVAHADPASFKQLRPSRVYGEDEIEGVEGPLRVARIDEPGGALIAWAMVARSQEEFAAADSALLSALVPHLAVALRGFAALEQERGRVAASDAALSRLGGGWLTIDGEGRVLAADRQGAALVRQGLGMDRLAGERLHVGVKSARALADAILACADPAASPRLVALSDPFSSRPALAMIAVPAPDGVPAALLGLVREAPRGEGRAAVVADLLGLLPSEARLAVALSEGASLAEAAMVQGLTIETARNYSKRIYAKTGARGQADLVRLILSGVAAFA